MTILNALEVLDEFIIAKSIPNVKYDFVLQGVAYSSRDVSQGYAFSALKGVKTDGHIYIRQCTENGAVLIICEDPESYERYSTEYPSIAFLLVSCGRKALAVLSKHFYECASDKLSVIGITGTKGKTSTSFMLSEILNKSGKRCGIIGTTGAYFEDYYEEMTHSTPESRELHRIFQKMLSLGATHVVMEVSSQALMMDRVYGISFDMGIFTNISPDHIGEGEHRDFDDYLYQKSRLFTMCRAAVVNKDADHADYIFDVCKKSDIKAVAYSCSDNSCSFFGSNEKFYISDGVMKTAFTVKTDSGESFEIEIGIPGKFSVFNALCAVTASMSLGCQTNDIKNALGKVKVIGRTEPVDNPRLPCPVIIDYAHNAVSLESLFAAVKAYNPNRIICVFGCGGNRSRLRRYEMGEISGKYADISIITADNSRFEELDDIIADILTGMKKTSGRYEIVKDRKEAIYRAISLSEKGDIVLLAGKGQETYLDVKGVKTHFDEREIVNSYFE